MSTAEILRPRTLQSYGAVITRYTPEHGVGYFVVQRKLDSDYNGGKHQNVMGKPKPKDGSPYATAKREAREEARFGITQISSETHSHEHEIDDRDDPEFGTRYMAKFFLTRVVGVTEPRLNHESSRGLWLPFREVIKLEFAPGSREAIVELAPFADSYYETAAKRPQLDLTQFEHPKE